MAGGNLEIFVRSRPNLQPETCQLATLKNVLAINSFDDFGVCASNDVVWRLAFGKRAAEFGVWRGALRRNAGRRARRVLVRPGRRIFDGPWRDVASGFVSGFAPFAVRFGGVGGLEIRGFALSLAGFGGDSWDFPESNSVSFAFADRVFSGVLGHFDVVANRGASAAELASVRACSSFRGAAPRVGLELKANFYATFALKSSRTGTVYTLQSPQNLFA